MGNRWGNSGNSVRLYFLGSKITADGDCSHEIKRRLLLGKDSDAGRDWGQEKKETTEDEIAGWHDQLDGHESE